MTRPISVSEDIRQQKSGNVNKSVKYHERIFMSPIHGYLDSKSKNL